MDAKRRLCGPDAVLTLTRHLYRVMIAGDTYSDAKNVRGVPRMPHHHIQIRATTTFPRPAAAAAGKFNSSTTHQRAPKWCGLGYAPRHWALRVRQPCGVLANQLNFPAACAAPEPCALALSESVLKKDDAQGFGSAYASGRGRWWCGGGRCRIKNSAAHFASVVPRSSPAEHQCCSVRGGANTKDAEIPRRLSASVVPRSSPPKQRCSGRGGVCFHAGTLRIDSGGKISCREDFFLWAAFLPHFCVSCECHSLSLLLRRCCES